MTDIDGLVGRLEERAHAFSIGTCTVFYEEDAELDRQAAAALRKMQGELSAAIREGSRLLQDAQIDQARIAELWDLEEGRDMLLKDLASGRRCWETSQARIAKAEAHELELRQIHKEDRARIKELEEALEKVHASGTHRFAIDVARAALKGK